MDLDTALELKERAVDQFGIIPSARAFALHDAVSRAVSVGGAVVAATRVDRAVERIGAPAVEAMSRVVNGTRDRVPAGRRLYGLGVAVRQAGDFGLAVRYPWTDTSLRPNYDELCEMAQGEVDVQWTGPVLAQTVELVPCPWHQERQRPLRIGSSIGHPRVGAGTLTAFVRRGDGAVEALSCNHVLTHRGTALHDPVLQPATADGGEAAHTIGQVSEIIPFQRGGPNLVDCALAVLSAGITADHQDLRGYGALGEVASAAWFDQPIGSKDLVKLGRTTGATRGRVSAFSIVQRIQYEGLGSYIFADLIEIVGEDGAPFSRPGDSGSLVFSPAEGNLACGMVIAGAEAHSYATRIDTVLSRVGAELITGGY